MAVLALVRIFTESAPTFPPTPYCKNKWRFIAGEMTLHRRRNDYLYVKITSFKKRLSNTHETMDSHKFLHMQSNWNCTSFQESKGIPASFQFTKFDSRELTKA